MEREQEGENLMMDWIEGQPAPKAVLVLAGLSYYNCIG